MSVASVVDVAISYDLAIVQMTVVIVSILTGLNTVSGRPSLTLTLTRRRPPLLVRSHEHDERRVTTTGCPIGLSFPRAPCPPHCAFICLLVFLLA